MEAGRILYGGDPGGQEQVLGPDPLKVSIPDRRPYKLGGTDRNKDRGDHGRGQQGQEKLVPYLQRELR